MATAVLVDAVRSAVGKRRPGGALPGVHPTDLLAQVLRHLVHRNDLDPATIEAVLAGCVPPGGEQAGNIARNVADGAEFPNTALQTMCVGGGIANAAIIERP